MDLKEYIAYLEHAVSKFKEEPGVEDGAPVEEWNDNFMLELYELTGDKGRP